MTKTREAELQARRRELEPVFQQKVDARVSRTQVHSPPWQWFSGVYFLESPGAVKIGYAYDVRVRLRSYRVSVVVTPEPIGFIQCDSEADARALECALHEAFGALRMGRREWFRDDPVIRDYVAAYAGKWPRPKAAAA